MNPTLIDKYLFLEHDCQMRHYNFFTDFEDAEATCKGTRKSQTASPLSVILGDRCTVQYKHKIEDS